MGHSEDGWTSHAMIMQCWKVWNNSEFGLMHYGKSLKILDVDFEKKCPNILPSFSDVVIESELFISKNSLI